MKTLTSKDGKWIAERLSNYDVQVSNVKTFTSYTIMANVKTGSTGGCTCSYGKRAGATCPHMALVKEFVAMEQAPVVVEVISAKAELATKYGQDVDMLFA